MGVMIRIKQLIWDDWNVEHIKKHQVSVGETEEVCRQPVKTLKTYKGRLIILGKTKKGRLLTMVLVPEGRGRYYVVTAREMSKKERRMLNDQT